MYTESFAGDIDGILIKMASMSSKKITFTLPRATGRADSNGLTKNQRDALADALLTAARGMMSDGIESTTVLIDEQRKIILRNWQQAANLYQTLTRNGFYAGLEGKKEKPIVKRYTA